jgi:hypothetical protein
VNITLLDGLLWFSAGLIIGGLAGWYAPRAYGLARTVYYNLKVGVCFHYRPTGRYETRKGTMSDFCRKCGHPAGYHRW